MEKIAALSLWDMLADEAADERELEKMVTEELVAWGLARRDAERAVAIMNAALGDSAPAAASQRPHTFHDDPLYLAVVAHIRDHMSG